MAVASVQVPGFANDGFALGGQSRDDHGGAAPQVRGGNFPAPQSADAPNPGQIPSDFDLRPQGPQSRNVAETVRKIM